VRIDGRVGDDEQGFSFPAELTKESRDDSFACIEKLWATRRVGEIIDELDLKGKNDELIKELVALSTRHGILTPYTSFLADETVDLRAVTANGATAGQKLELLERSAEGKAGVAQRSFKSTLQNAPAAPAPSSASSTYGFNSYRDAATDQDVVVAGNRNVGNRSFFRRNGTWMDSTVNEEQMKNARRYVQFTDEYFELAAKHGRQLTQYLVSDEPVVVNLDGETFLIEPAK
jgi:Ca-activated chloride channel family protein